MFGFTGELDHAARVTEEAEMDMSIAAFFFVPRGNPLMTKSPKKIGVIRKEGMERCSLNRRDI